MDNIKHIIGSEAYHLLINGNITTLQDIVMTDIKIIQEVTLAPLDVAKNIVLAASKEILTNKIQTADEIKPWQRVSTGCDNIDRILLGGIPANGISELYGCSGVGKTQFCLQLALHIQLFGDSNKETIYISTETAFPSKRLHQLAKAFKNKLNVNINFEDHIYVEHIVDSTHLQNCLSSQLPYFLSTKNVGLIIIDSIAGVFRSDNENVNYASRSRELKLICNALIALQDQYGCAVLIVNQVTDNISAQVSVPCLGLAWANNITCRFCLSRNSASTERTFEVVFAPDLPPLSSNIIITPEGLFDV